MNNNKNYFKIAIMLLIMYCPQLSLANSICREIFTESSSLICNPEIVGKCLNDGWPIDYKDKNNRTLLHKASMFDNCVDTTKMLLEKNQDLLTSKDSYKITPFMYTYVRCDIGASEYLLEKGANPYEIHLTDYLLLSCLSYPEQPISYISCCHEYEDLINKYKAQKKTYSFLNKRQTNEKNLAWLVESELYFKDMDSLRWYEKWGLSFLQYLPPYVQLKAVGLFKSLQADYTHLPQVVGYADLLKHVGIKFHNGSIFNYFGSVPMVVEQNVDMPEEELNDLTMFILNYYVMDEYEDEGEGKVLYLEKGVAEFIKNDTFLNDTFFSAEEALGKDMLIYALKNHAKYIPEADSYKVVLSTKIAVEYMLKNGTYFFYELMETFNDEISNYSDSYTDRKFGRYKLAFEAKLMEEAIRITRKKWDVRNECWDGVGYDLMEHSCQTYVDDTVKVYLGLGGLIFLGTDVGSRG